MTGPRTPTAGQFRQADAIFDAALDLEPDERDAFVDRACEGDPTLRLLVRRLLRALRRSGEFLMQPALAMAGPLLDTQGEDGVAVHVPIPDRVGPYRIVRELGRGGMGVVYLAMGDGDAEGMPVALKVVRDGTVAAGGILRRFLAERHILGTLDHPFIARLVDAGITSDGAPYFAMVHCVGGSLSERLSRRALSVPDKLRIACQLAEALGAAHALGVVHRDIKPANILFNAAGDVQLTDFGVAKLLDQETTRSGTLVGTPAYLAPEQLRGRGVDHRADLWALGVTLYEMLAGRRPFDGPSYAAILHAVLTVEPEKLNVTAEVSPALVALVNHLLRKDADGRPRSAAEVARVLTAIAADPDTVYQPGAVALPEPASTPSFRARAASVVVLPFNNTSGNPDDTPFADGLTDELISGLGQVRGLRVTARTTAFALRGKGLDARAVAGMIGVAYLLEGSVRRDGDRLKISAQLIHAAQGTVEWSETYNRRAEDIFAVQEELGRAIVAALAPRLGLSDAAHATARPRDLVTYELFLKGRHFWEKRSTPDLLRAAEYFGQAIARDPTYAEAYAGLADTHLLITLFGNRRPAEGHPLARAAMAEALRLGGGIAMVHAAHGNLLSAIEWRWAESESECRRAVELDPGHINGRIFLAILLQHLGRFDEAIEVAAEALVLDPLSPGLNLTLGRAHLNAGRPAEAIASLRTAIEIAPGFAFAHQQLGHALLLAGRKVEALQAFQRGADGRGPNQLGELSWALAMTGNDEGARTVLRDLLATEDTGYLPPYGVACAYAGLGDADAAFAWLDRGFAERAATMNMIKVAPTFYPLYSDRRWRELLDRMDLSSPR